VTGALPRLGPFSQTVTLLSGKSIECPVKRDYREMLPEWMEENAEIQK
jgi:hypothetical protein